MSLSEGSSRSGNNPESADTIDKIREVIKTHRTARIDGMTVDELTAQEVVQVFDRLPASKRQKLAKLSAKKLICKALEIASKG